MHLTFAYHITLHSILSSLIFLPSPLFLPLVHCFITLIDRVGSPINTRKILVLQPSLIPPLLAPRTTLSTILTTRPACLNPMIVPLICYTLSNFSGCVAVILSLLFVSLFPPNPMPTALVTFFSPLLFPIPTCVA